MNRRLTAPLPPLLLLAGVIGAWEAYVDLGSPSEPPAPHAIAAALWNNAGLLATNLRITAEEVAAGVLLALLIGFVLAVAIHLSATLRRAIYPLAVGSQAVPIVVIAPLLVIWWGFGLLPKLFVIVLVCFFPVVVTTVDGLAAVDPDQLKLLRTLGATRRQAFWFAEMPAALPAALSGTRIAVTVAFIGAVVAEISTAGTSSGLGHLIQLDLNGLTAEQARVAWAATIVLFGFAILCFYGLGAGARRLAPWAPGTDGRGR